MADTVYVSLRTPATRCLGLEIIVYAAEFLYPQRHQPLLLPVDMREWLPEDDLVLVVPDAVGTSDLGELRCQYRADGHGRAAFDPEMMVPPLPGLCQRIGGVPHAGID